VLEYACRYAKNMSESGVPYWIRVACCFTCNEYGMLTNVVASVLCNQEWLKMLMVLLPIIFNLMINDKYK